MSRTVDRKRLEEIRDEIKRLADEALRIISDDNRWSGERFKSYGHPGIVMACDHDHNYLGSCQYTIQNAIDAMDDGDEEEDEEDPERFE